MARVRTTPGQPTAPEQRTEQVQLRVTATESAAWRAAADHHGLTLSRWMRQHLDLAAKTRSAAIAPIALKNAWAVRSKLTEMHGIIIHSPMPEQTRQALLQHTELLREPVSFLINVHIAEHQAS